MNPERLSALIDKYLNNAASPEEEQELNTWYHAANQQEVPWEVSNEQEAHALKALLLNKLQQAMQPRTSAKTIPFYRRSAWRAAAALVLLLGVAAWLWLSRTKQSATAPGIVTTTNHTIVPGGNKAVLTLSDGSTIVLDSAASATMLATQGNTHIIKLNSGQLAYQNAQNVIAGIPQLYNTIETPKGGQYEIILPDGSHVWLNAASSLRFPAAFTGKERDVELTGEAYFEVVKSPGQPFKVNFSSSVGKAQVEVLGTHFNINAYSDETNSRTTLLEGKVKISNSPSDVQQPISEILFPGQQAAITVDANKIKVQEVDAEASIAWKNGVFNFDKVDIKTVMRQIARWYDVEVVYEGAVSTEKFEGEIPRSSTLTDVFKILELSAVHFKIEGRKVIVMP
jgi:transmembrane sensor